MGRIMETGTMEEIPKPCFSKAQPPSPSARSPIRPSLAWSAPGIKPKRQTWRKQVRCYFWEAPCPGHPTHPLTLFTARMSKKNQMGELI